MTRPCGILAATSQWQVDIGPIIADLTKSTTQMSFPGFSRSRGGVGDGGGGAVDRTVPIAKDDGTTASAARAADALAPPVATHWNCVGACGADAQMKPSVTLGALKADSWQRVRIRAGNGFGWGAWSEPVQYKTDRGGAADLAAYLFGAGGIDGLYAQILAVLEAAQGTFNAACAIEPPPPNDVWYVSPREPTAAAPEYGAPQQQPPPVRFVEIAEGDGAGSGAGSGEGSGEGSGVEPEPDLGVEPDFVRLVEGGANGGASVAGARRTLTPAAIGGGGGGGGSGGGGARAATARRRGGDARRGGGGGEAGRGGGGGHAVVAAPRDAELPLPDGPHVAAARALRHRQSRWASTLRLTTTTTRTR